MDEATVIPTRWFGNYSSIPINSTQQCSPVLMHTLLYWSFHSKLVHNSLNRHKALINTIHLLLLKRLHSCVCFNVRLGCCVCVYLRHVQLKNKLWLHSISYSRFGTVPLSLHHRHGLFWDINGWQPCLMLLVQGVLLLL